MDKYESVSEQRPDGKRITSMSWGAIVPLLPLSFLLIPIGLILLLDVSALPELAKKVTIFLIGATSLFSLKINWLIHKRLIPSTDYTLTSLMWITSLVAFLVVILMKSEQHQMLLVVVGMAAYALLRVVANYANWLARAK